MVEAAKYYPHSCMGTTNTGQLKTWGVNKKTDCKDPHSFLGGQAVGKKPAEAKKADASPPSTAIKPASLKKPGLGKKIAKKGSAKKASSVSSTEYKGSISNAISFLLANQKTELKIGEKTFSVKQGEFYFNGKKVSENGFKEALRTALKGTFGSDAKPYYAYHVLNALSSLKSLNADGKSIDLKSLVNAAKKEAGSTKQRAEKVVIQAKIDEMGKTPEKKDLAQKIKTLQEKVAAYEEKPSTEAAKEVKQAKEALVGAKLEEDAKKAYEKAEEILAESEPARLKKENGDLSQKIQDSKSLADLKKLEEQAKKLGLTETLDAKKETVAKNLLDTIRTSAINSISQEELSFLLPYLDSDQKIVQYEHNEKTYTVLTQENKENKGQYKFLTFLGDKGEALNDHYIMEENGDWVVKERGSISDSTIAKVDYVVEQKNPSVQTANGVVSGNFWANLDVKDENNDGKINFADIDTNSDGYVDEDEADAVGIKARLFKVIDSNMDANGLNGDGKITLAELQKFNEVASEFARLTGRTLSETLLLYKTCELTNISLGELAEAHGNISTAINNNLNGQSLALENIEKILQGCGYTGFIISSVKAQLNEGAAITPAAIASVVVNLVLGSQFEENDQKELWKIDKPLTKSFPATQDLTANNIEKFITGEELEEDEDGESGKKGELTNAEKKKLNKLFDKEGKEAELIKYLKKLRGKYPKNLQIQDRLLDAYDKNKGYLAEALKEAMSAYEKNPDDDRREKFLLRIADKYARKMGSEELLEEGRLLAENAYQKIKEIISKKYEDNKTLQLKYSAADKFLKALMKYEIDDKDLQTLAYIANSLKELKDPPLPGQIEFKKIALNEEKEVTVTEIKKAYDNFAQKLETELKVESKKASPDNRKLVRIYIKLAQIENLKGNIEKVKEYTLKALGLHAKLDTDDELRDNIIDSAERIIKQYYGFKTAPSEDGRQRSVKMLEIAKEIFVEYKKAQENAGKNNIEIIVKDENQEKTHLKTGQDFEGKKARNTVDADELVTHIFRLASHANAVLDNKKAKLSPESQKQFALMALYLLEKYKKDNTFYKKIAKWAKKFAKENQINNEVPLNPLGKFKGYETAKAYIEYLAGVREEKQG